MSPATVALELCDAGLLAVGEDGPLAPASPGYAVVDGGELVTGRAARARARLTPRRTHHRFWHELDDTPLPPPFPRRWTHTDLVYRHLSDLRRELALELGSVIAVAAGDARPDELARVLGVAAAAGWPIAGVVDAGVAAAPEPDGDFERAWHLDLGLHRAVATELALESGAVRGRVLAAEGGLVELERIWARFFAGQLVRATRFDALHSAASEQRLYEAMDGWLAELRRGESAVIGLSAGEREHQVEISRRELEAAAADAYRRIAGLFPPDADLRSSRLLLSARAARLPGLAAALEPVAGPAVELAPEAAVAGSLAARDLILAGGEELSFVVRLPARQRGAA